ncbi:MAG: type II toxin-antitoxin system RelE/ParE family toxin [Acholeplasmataceae bacterium]|nr:type II toxin-antitoxin system RelE/ParE family toxin [Acholeplasmataceae bacterium]
MYSVEISEYAIKQFKKLDKQIASMIFAWITKHLEGCDNPRLHGKGLIQDKKGIWRYRIGDYRLLAHILENRLVILVVDVGYRREIYK